MVAALLAAPADAAGPAAPTGLAPAGISAAATPVLSWNRAAGATSYVVQVSASADFETVLAGATTVNRRYVPLKSLPTGQVWWRVLSRSTAGDSAWATTSFDVAASPGPVLTSPQDGATLGLDQDALVLSWTDVPGASSYTVEIDETGDFFAPTVHAAVRTTSYVVASPELGPTYHWRVKAVFEGGRETEYSDVRTFELGPLPAARPVGPPDATDPTVDDATLAWEPVPGATTYDVQLSTGEEFPDDSRTTVTGLFSTRYTPNQRLANDRYFWRVRPVDTFGNAAPWPDDPWTFRTGWPDQPTLEYPVDDAVVGDPMFFQWTGVRSASQYTLQLSDTANFPDDGTTRSCSTVHTTFVPKVGSDCWPAASGSFYWRVLAVDGPANVPSETAAAPTAHFSYAPAEVDPDTMSPADGDSVTLPILRWGPVAGAARYRISLVPLGDGDGGFTNRTVTTASYVPVTRLTPGESYRWIVVPVSQSGRVGDAPQPEDQPVFTVTAPEPAVGVAPIPTGPEPEAAFRRSPLLTWTPVADADYYKVGFRDADGIDDFTFLSSRFEYPAGVDAASVNQPRRVEWQVRAYDVEGNELATGSSRVFAIEVPDQVTGQRAALTGVATGSAVTSCAAQLPDRCADLRQTPTLRWDPDPQAGSYKIWIARDRALTNVVPGFDGVQVDGTAYAPTVALPDSQNGEAYYWYVAACTVDQACAPRDDGRHAFTKTSNGVELTAPADGADVTDTVTFAWRDFLATNQDGAPGHLDATGVPARAEAKQYRVEVSASPGFQPLVDSATVDALTYTAPKRLYPEGTLYWRVAAVDGSDNRLAYCEPRSFTKRTPPPQLHDMGEASSGSTPPLTWSPTSFADSYDVEVYRDADTGPSLANRVYAGNTRQAALALATPLPPSLTAYTWRVRTVDPSNNKGPWTSLTDPFASFQVAGEAPSPISPMSGAYVPNNGALFTWTAVTGAKSYRFERRRAGTTTLSESVTTAATFWAPTAVVPDGSYEWRVVAVDNDGDALGASAWRAVKVDSTRPTVTSVRPAAGATSVSPYARIHATFSEPVIGVGSATVKLFRRGSATPVPATVTYSASGHRVTLDPRGKLQRGTTYVARLTSGIRDLSGLALVPKKWSVRVRG